MFYEKPSACTTSTGSTYIPSTYSKWQADSKLTQQQLDEQRSSLMIRSGNLMRQWSSFIGFSCKLTCYLVLVLILLSLMISSFLKHLLGLFNLWFNGMKFFRCWFVNLDGCTNETFLMLVFLPWNMYELWFFFTMACSLCIW